MPTQAAPSVGRLAGPTSPLVVIVSAGRNPSSLPSAEASTDEAAGAELASTSGSVSASATGSGNAAGADGLAARGAAEPAKTLALDAATGAVVWQYDMPLWHGAAAGDTPTHACAPDSSANSAIGGDGVAYVPHEDGRVYAIRDANGDGAIHQGEVSSWGFDMAFQGSPAIAPGLLAVSPCDGLAAWHVPLDSERAVRRHVSRHERLTAHAQEEAPNNRRVLEAKRARHRVPRHHNTPVERSGQ
mmetsp:Transcript_43267/g.119679  ORF Transcript_43267/g.119679 Transcript_43267/m.119679 type:complete len:244 (+) Transcript_43267:449-1180(+)